ncbi:MAG: D-alanyl-D-alanine carboxypeptidase/D-alanyl-D-alanine-endopeptidase [Armatimonadetes bacterium JP3_11]|jgi:PBP4 family serine-type D-alanyl-D-alanine carboxypeptidase|nr:MAG: D-alanyl-D-alanine carboxypeptidase/D-alanyl-D-alanine-endopeptidase [Armatimonadetes bacterium CP1_7O]OYT69896.1 MAG: D-alanyl-D-alanine carboxypeptidase/D-alanyl-D-alanine-endopeptidase [Armatimonadetes bacterium JP3_11]
MRHRVAALIGLLTLASAFAQTLATELDALLGVEWLRYGYCGVVVRDVQSGETLYKRDAERLLIPASNMKLIVSAAALHLLGEDYRFRTRVWARGTLSPDGALQGDLILQGLGDATLEMRDLQSLAQRVYEAGIRRVAGYLVYDDSWLDADRYGFGWNIDDEPYGYQAQMSALCAERNAVRLYAQPGSQIGEPARIRIEPETDYVEIVNRTRTVAPGARDARLDAIRTRARNQIIVYGTIAFGAAEVALGRYSVENPSHYAAHLFRQALQAIGISVEKGIVPNMTPLEPTQLRLVAEHHSPPMREVVALINKPSDNLLTEITLKVIGKETRGAGTTAAGIQAVREFLQQAGLEMGAVHLVDGSGLSRINGVSPENFVRLLEFMHRSPHAEAFRHSLPVYGVDGTLRNRLRDTPVQGNGYAKTGSLNRVSSLSGYLRTKSGRWLAFSIIMNAYNASGSDARALQDKVIQLLWERL